MKARSATLTALCGLMAALFVGVPDRLPAQAPPGPLPPSPQVKASLPPPPKPVAKPKPPEIPARRTLDGPWKLDLDDSDDPKTKIQDSRGVKAHGNGPSGGGPGGGGGGYPGGGYPGGGYPGGGYPGGGYPGGGYPGGGYPGGGGGGPYGGQDTSARDTETDERLEQLIRPPTTLNFAVKNPEVDITDDASRKLAIFTDGRKLAKSKDDSYREIAAHWEGTQLVTDEKTPQGAKMNRTFELSPDGKQFYESIRVDRGKSKGMLNVRYVYDASSGHESELTHATDPDQPVMKRRSDSSNGDASSQGSQTGQPSDPDQPVMKRRSDDSSTTSSSPDTHTDSPPDPDQPVMKRRTDGQ